MFFSLNDLFYIGFRNKKTKKKDKKKKITHSCWILISLTYIDECDWRGNILCCLFYHWKSVKIYKIYIRKEWRRIKWRNVYCVIDLCGIKEILKANFLYNAANFKRNGFFHLDEWWSFLFCCVLYFLFFQIALKQRITSINNLRVDWDFCVKYYWIRIQLILTLHNF